MLEKILQFSINNRWLIVLLAVGAALIGGFSLQRLPIDAVPDITNNQVQINTEFAALSPFEIEKQVTYPVETALAGIPGLQYTRSISRNGFSQVTAVFNDNVDIYFARQQVAERLGSAKESLPPGADPVMGAISTGLGEVFMYTVEYKNPHGKGATPADGKPGWQSDGSYLTPEGESLKTDVELSSYLRTVQDWIIAPQLKGVKDVAGVDSIGGYVKQYHVQPNPMKLVSYGLSFSHVIEALERNNVSTGAGYVEHKGESYTVRASGRIENESQIANIVLGTRNGTPIYIRDVASVSVGRELRTGSASENGEEVVVGTSLMLIGANSRTVAADVEAKIIEIAKSLPEGVIAKPVLNRTKLVDATIQTVSKNLAEGAILVVVVLFLLLGNIRAAIICALAIPMSMLMTSFVMVQGKISGNLMSLGAIDFGIIIDGAVIIVENCLRVLGHRQHELGRRLTLPERLAAVTEATKQMVKPSVYGQAIIVTVYLPILFLTGTEGKMFQPMALTVIIALAAAFILSLTLVPALMALLVSGKVSEKDNFAIRGVKTAYAPILNWSIGGRWIVVPVAIVGFLGSVLLFMRMGSEFVPTLDEKDIAMHAMRIPSTGITQSQKMQTDIERMIATIPEVAFVYSKTGTAEMASDPMPPNVSDTFIIFKPKQEWRSEAEIERLIEAKEKETGATAHEGHREEGGGHEEHAEADISTHKGKLQKLIQLTLAAVPGNNYEFTQPIQMRFNELISGVRSDVAVKVYGERFEDMVPTANAIAKVLTETSGSADVKVEQTEGLPIMDISVDRDAIARYGLNMADVQEVIAIAIGGREAGEVFQGDRRFDLIVRLPDEVRRDIDGLENLPIPLPSVDESSMAGGSVGEVAGGPRETGFVPLGSIATISIAEGPNQISRENGKRRVVVQANVRGRDIGSFVAEAQNRMNEQVKLPAGNWLEWGGQFENLVAARQRLMIVVPLCFFMIFLLLFSTFKSVKYAVMVFTGVPLALTGGILALWLRGMPFSITAAVGFIALSGVAVLNGLVMVSFINELRQKGMLLDDAIREGSLTRLRPVLMTALVAALGFVPMALATGTGAEVQKPLATVVIGGIVSSTLLTLLVLPALYRMLHPKDGEESSEPAAVTGGQVQAV
jgi:cobalt-zinc-cadmium resistance protein CzcA